MRRLLLAVLSAASACADPMAEPIALTNSAGKADSIAVAVTLHPERTAPWLMLECEGAFGCVVDLRLHVRFDDGQHGVNVTWDDASGWWVPTIQWGEPSPLVATVLRLEPNDEIVEQELRLAPAELAFCQGEGAVYGPSCWWAYRWVDWVPVGATYYQLIGEAPAEVGDVLWSVSATW